MAIFYLGTPDRIRTYDLLLRKQTLYPAELRVHMWMQNYIHLEIITNITREGDTIIIPRFFEK